MITHYVSLTNALRSVILGGAGWRAAIYLLGGMAERFIAAVLKTVDREIRGFESLSLRWRQSNRCEQGEVPEWSIGTAC